MGTKSQMFRVFVEGETISDGRKITPDMIDQCVETFDAATYTPRINVEHITGFSPEPPFNGYGDVVALEARDDTVNVAGVATQRHALYAQIDANDQLVTLFARDQKPFPSVELTGNYAGTGKVGLVGLAFTDTPASIATQRAQFSRVNGLVIATAADRADVAFAAKPADSATIADAIKAGFAGVAALFKREDAEKPPVEPKKPANDNGFDPAAFATALGDTMATSVAAALKPVSDAQATLQAEVAALKSGLERTEAPGFSRPPASGAQIDAKYATDC